MLSVLTSQETGAELSVVSMARGECHVSKLHLSNMGKRAGSSVEALSCAVLAAVFCHSHTMLHVWLICPCPFV